MTSRPGGCRPHRLTSRARPLPLTARGREIAARTPAGLEVFEVIAPAALMAPPHVSPWTGVLCLVQGQITALVGGTTYDVEPGGVVVF
ncbi:MAG: hypothetical protein ACXWDM_00885, partial [Nocardioides sp.]